MGLIALGASILDALLFGYKQAQQNGTPLPVRTIFNIIGATLTDDPTNKATVITIPGVMGAGIPFTIDGASAPIAAGQWFTVAPGGATVTLATAGTTALMPGVLGVAMNGGSGGAVIDGNVELMVPNSISGLGAGGASRVRLNTSTSRAERVSTFGTSDYPLGVCNAVGDLLLVRGIVMQLTPSGAAGGSLTGTYPNPGINLATGVSAWAQVKKTANYTINLATDLEILVDTSGGAFSLQWPAHQVGGEIFIKDVGGALATNNLTLLRAGTEKIENVAASRVFSAAGGSWRISDDGTNLWVNS